MDTLHEVGDIVLTRNIRQIRGRLVRDIAVRQEIGTVDVDAEGVYYRMRKIGSTGPGGQIRWRESDVRPAN